VTSGGNLCPVAIALAVDHADRVIVGDGSEHAVRVYSSDLVPITAWGLPSAYGIAVGPSGDIYVAEGCCAVSRWTVDGTFLQRWGGGSGSGPGQFSNAWAVAVDASGFVYVADYGNSRIQKFTANGTYVTMWGSFGSGDGQFIYPTNISIDPTGTILVADPYNNRIEEFTPDGVFVSAWGTSGQGPGQFGEPYGLAAFDAYVFVADAGNSRIQKFGHLPTRAQATTWGRLKAIYR
jgi:DNA-binding beta-propeller fold protein YncE